MSRLRILINLLPPYGTWATALSRHACQSGEPLPQPSEYMGKSCHMPTWTSRCTPLLASLSSPHLNLPTSHHNLLPQAMSRCWCHRRQPSGPRSCCLQGWTRSHQRQKTREECHHLTAGQFCKKAVHAACHDHANSQCCAPPSSVTVAKKGEATGSVSKL